MIFDLVSIASADTHVEVRQEIRTDADDMLRPTIVHTMLTHVVKRGMKDEHVTRAPLPIEPSTVIETGSAWHVSFDKLLSAFAMSVNPFAIAACIGIESRLHEVC